MGRRSMKRRTALLWVLPLFVSVGCAIGDGEGEVKGTIHISGCMGEGDDLTSQEAFDLRPSFFAGEPIDDPSGSGETNQLRIRVQSSGANPENADSLVIELNDVGAVATRLGEWLDVYAGGDASPAEGVQQVGRVRASLNLMRTCARRFPGVGQWTLVAHTDKDYAHSGVHSKIRFTRLGKFGCVGEEGSVSECNRSDGGPYAVGFGGVIRAEFDFHLVDPRPEYLGPEYPSLGAGHIVGYFEFTMRRGRVAQMFP